MKITPQFWLEEGNPQLIREWKGRLKPAKLAIASLVSAVGQIFVYLYYRSQLPENREYEYDRYCLGGLNDRGNYQDHLCVKDSFGQHILIDRLWWLDLFIEISIIGIFVLLIVGTYLLIADLSKEERRGTLDFIRLSPQSAASILIGKIFGVPILVYLTLALALPLHLWSGIAAGIPLSLIGGFYLVLVASCACFYSVAILLGLVGKKISSKAWLGSGALLLLGAFATAIALREPAYTSPGAWLKLFYPGTVLVYLVKSTFLPFDTVGYLDPDGLTSLLWYGKPLFSHPWLGIGFVLFNYSLWTGWLWQGIKRRFDNPTATVLSKGQSYCLSCCFVASSLGFVLQVKQPQLLLSNYSYFLFLILALFLVLIAALSPHRQTLQDWARYRHQASREHRNLLKDLVWGEKSPAILAIALNLTLVIAYTLPSIFLFPLAKYRIPVLFGLLLTGSMILIYAVIAQLMLTMKTSKRAIWAAATVGGLMVFPLSTVLVLQVSTNPAHGLWLFSLVPVVATEYAKMTTIFSVLAGQWLAIALVTFQISRQLRCFGKSETKALLSKNLR